MKPNLVPNLLIVLLALTLFSGCASTNHQAVGYDGTDLETGVRATVRMQENEIYMTVRNQYQVDYQVWVVYKYRSPYRNRYTEERIHEGSEYQRDFIVTIPNDLNDLNDVSRESVKVYVTSIENLDIDASLDMYSTQYFTGDSMLDGFSTISGFVVKKRGQYFETPEIVLNSSAMEGSYSNTLHDNFKENEK